MTHIYQYLVANIYQYLETNIYQYLETYIYLEILTRWVYYPEFPNLWNHSNCPEQCCLISKRIEKNIENH